MDTVREREQQQAQQPWGKDGEKGGEGEGGAVVSKISCECRDLF